MANPKGKPLRIEYIGVIYNSSHGSALLAQRVLMVRLSVSKLTGYLANLEV